MSGLTRRGFLKLIGTSVAASGLNLTLSGSVRAFEGKLKIANAKENFSVCCYCAVGCGLIIHTENGKVINIEGNPDSPINRGSLCSKGSALRFLVNNEERLKKPLYRAPGSDKWEEISWDKAITEIARRIKSTRDKYFEYKNKEGVVVNRVTKIASVGSAAMDNEECYLYQKFLRSLGLVYIEHQARI